MAQVGDALGRNCGSLVLDPFWSPTLFPLDRKKSNIQLVNFGAFTEVSKVANLPDFRITKMTMLRQKDV